MERLKHDTRAEHLNLETRVPLLNPGLTLEQYGAVLQAFASVVLPLERRLVALNLPAALDYPSRQHTPALQADLTRLGLTVPERQLPGTLALRLPAAYGVLYVLEGSTLGGQLISRHLRKHLNLGDDTGAAYFSGYGPDTGAKWRAFQHFMLDTVQPDWHDEIIEEARTTFHAFAAALSSTVSPLGPT